jgi:Bacterial dnaA protein helix-turn-helix
VLGTNRNAGIWRPSLEQIESTVSIQLGPGRVTGNQQGPCLSRQISMYLAKHVGGWSTVKIGRFYSGRHHTTVLHSIQKVQRLRSVDESIDALIEVLIVALREDVGSSPAQSTAGLWPLGRRLSKASPATLHDLRRHTRSKPVSSSTLSCYRGFRVRKARR